MTPKHLDDLRVMARNLRANTKEHAAITAAIADAEAAAASADIADAGTAKKKGEKK